MRRAKRDVGAAARAIQLPASKLLEQNGGGVNLTLGTLGLIANALEVEAHVLPRPSHLVRRGAGPPAKRKR